MIPSPLPVENFDQSQSSVQNFDQSEAFVRNFDQSQYSVGNVDQSQASMGNSYHPQTFVRLRKSPSSTPGVNMKFARPLPEYVENMKST